jgi:hypothetical protein
MDNLRRNRYGGFMATVTAHLFFLPVFFHKDTGLLEPNLTLTELLLLGL